MSSSPPTSCEKLSLGTKVAWGFGGVADNLIMNVPILLAMPIYNIGLHLNPAALGTAMLIPGAIDAFLNPLVGNITDNTRSRWGRRRPYIAIGSMIPAIMLPLLWMPPVTTTSGMFWYILVSFFIYYLFYTVFVVPYTALGYELTTDYNERTRVLAWRMYIGVGASLSTPWLYKICALPAFGNIVIGARFVSLGIAVLIVVTGLIPAIFCRERTEAQAQPQVSLRSALKYTANNKPFLFMLGTYIVILSGFLTSCALQLYVNIYYVCKGNHELAGTLVGMFGTIVAGLSYVSLPLFTWISTHWGKRPAMVASLSLSMSGTLVLWLTMGPLNPYLQMTAAVFFGLSLQGCWLLISSMVADICDEDELRTGMRREGVYSAVTALSLKLAVAMTSLLSGLCLTLAHFDAAAADRDGVPVQVITNLRLFYFGAQGLAFSIGAVLFCFYPISRERALETRRILDERKQLMVNS